ncbi:hypothetical protein KBZ10_17180 [Streptomyces sp. F63]|uniref:hypothetical protein n=1 Tax=Streptomyces sp. F63 TaxID=2824887 RepID=UPI001B35AE85|nr:hypothetical protein [Streptomyces sp. F63]MBQ0986214.1 hypothetical protein [Streptomyces sp. F63]
MNKSVWKRLGAAAASVAVLAGVAGCGGDEKTSGAPEKAAGEQKTILSPAEAITAAFEKTAEAKSAKVRMTMSMPDSAEGGGEMEMSGVMGWDPMVMDMTMSGSALANGGGAKGGPKSMRMMWLDNVMYMDMGAEAGAEMDGKRWMKMDIAAMAEASGDEALSKQMTGGLEEMNQDPAQQMAMLLESPNLKDLGEEKVEGMQTRHYKGTLSVKEMMEANESLKLLDAKERKELIANLEKSGITGYDTEVWVNEDNYPVKMDIGMDSPEGTVNISAVYSDYGAKADVTAPPAAETFDFTEMMEELAAGA